MSNLENKDAIQILAKEINSLVDEKIRTAKFDRTVKARVTAILNDTNKYLVMIDGQEMEAISYNQLSVGDICFVTISQNDYNNLFISSPANRSNQASSWEIERRKLIL